MAWIGDQNNGTYAQVDAVRGDRMVQGQHGDGWGQHGDGWGQRGDDACRRDRMGQGQRGDGGGRGQHGDLALGHMHHPIFSAFQGQILYGTLWGGRSVLFFYKTFYLT